MFAKSVYKILLICLYLNFIVIISFMIVNHGLFTKSATVHNVDTKNLSRLSSSSQDEPVDVVYTWVDDSDPKFMESLQTWREIEGDNRNVSSQSKRFTNWNTLLFSLRSIEKYADWIRHVYIVTNGQIPQWLNLSCPRVTIVTHEDIFTNKSHLPTFSSCAIETHIHHIRGLSKRFLYLNDDIFFGQPVTLEDFYSEQKGTLLRLTKTSIKNCTQECSIAMINNNQCDEGCNLEQCEWDGKDCGIKHIPEYVAASLCKRYGLFFGAIFHTAVVFNEAFGYVYREVPAHVPHFIDKDVMTELQNRFPKEWDETSSHRFRSTLTLQYAFAYYHYLMAPSSPYRYTTSKRDYMFIQIEQPDKLIKLLESRLNNTERRKFVCLNDNAKYENVEERENMQRQLVDFMKKLFPTPSAFEKLNIFEMSS